MYRNYKNLDPDILFKMVYISTLLALILALPGVSALLAIYYLTGNLLIGTLVFFLIHFGTLMFSPKISEALQRFFD